MSIKGSFFVHFLSIPFFCLFSQCYSLWSRDRYSSLDTRCQSLNARNLSFYFECLSTHQTCHGPWMEVLKKSLLFCTPDIWNHVQLVDLNNGLNIPFLVSDFGFESVGRTLGITMPSRTKQQEIGTLGQSPVDPNTHLSLFKIRSVI